MQQLLAARVQRISRWQ